MQTATQSSNVMIPPPPVPAMTTNNRNRFCSLGKRFYSDIVVDDGNSSEEDSSPTSTQKTPEHEHYYNKDILSSLKKKRKTLPTTQPIKPKIVRFASVKSFQHQDKYSQQAVTVLSPEEHEHLWYSRRDLRDMKVAAKRLCRQLDHPTSDPPARGNMDSMLSTAYGLPIPAHDYVETLPDVATLLYSNKNFENQRGLERWTSQSLMLSRCITIVRARTEVQLEQINQTIGGQSDPQKIADLYKEASRQAGSFARVLGLADAALLDME